LATRVRPVSHASTSFVQAVTWTWSLVQAVVPQEHSPAFLPTVLQQVVPVHDIMSRPVKSQKQSSEPAVGLSHPTFEQKQSPPPSCWQQRMPGPIVCSLHSATGLMGSMPRAQSHTPKSIPTPSQFVDIGADPCPDEPCPHDAANTTRMATAYDAIFISCIVVATSLAGQRHSLNS
jgi:hypothetical protein